MFVSLSLLSVSAFVQPSFNNGIIAEFNKVSAHAFHDSPAHRQLPHCCASSSRQSPVVLSSSLRSCLLSTLFSHHCHTHTHTTQTVFAKELADGNKHLRRRRRLEDEFVVVEKGLKEDLATVNELLGAESTRLDDTTAARNGSVL